MIKILLCDYISPNLNFKHMTTLKITLVFILTFFYVSTYAQTTSKVEPIKRVLVEESTGTWCASCAYGSVYFEHLKLNYPNAIPVAIHTGPGGQDPMAILSVELYMSSYFGGSPTFLFDRKDFPFNSSNKSSISASNTWEHGLDTLNFYLDKIYNQAPIATIGINQTYNASTKQITVTITSNFIQNATGDFRLNCFILEDSVTGGTAYDQANSNFSGWTSGPAYLQPLINQSHPITGYVHNHVLRKMLGNPEGATANIPTTVISGSSYSKTFTYTVPSNIDENKITLVGLIQRYGSDQVSDREVINANSQHLSLVPISISDISQNFVDISIYPNPITEKSTIEFYVRKNDNIKCDLLSSFGQLIKPLFNKHFTQGEYLVNFDRSNLSNGVYFLKFSNSQTTVIKKIVVSK